MKQFLRSIHPWVIGAAAITCTFLLPQTTYAADPAIQTLVDGRQLEFDVPPVIQDGRTLVPMRGFLTALGAEIGWDQESRTAIAMLGGTEVKATIGSHAAQVNGAEVTMDIPAQIIDDRTMVPLRFFVENLGLQVTWDGETRTILVDTRRSEMIVSRDGSTANRRGTAMVEAAMAQVGAPYAWGGTTPAGFDCSGFITYLSRLIELDLPRTSYEMFTVGVPVKQDELLPGDLVFFTTYDSGASHVGVYDGNGSFVHAQSAETGVKVTPMSNPWWSARYLGARRVIR